MYFIKGKQKPTKQEGRTWDDGDLAEKINNNKAAY